MDAVDRLFDRGALVRAWTQRGTLHIVPAEDLAWMLRVTAERQLQMAAPRYRELGLGAPELASIERLLVGALRGGNALTRAEVFDVLERAGIGTDAQRGAHAVQNLALRGIICQGPVVHRPDAVSREQLFVLSGEHLPSAPMPSDPAVEMFVRYIIGHGPATAEDFAWWAGVTLAVARAAAASASDSRLHEVENGCFVAATRPRRSASAAAVLALGAFEEFYISYRDRSPAGDAERLALVGPGKNGMVRPIILRDGEIVGVWKQSTAVGRHTEAPAAELFAHVDEQQLAGALSRYAAFVSG